MYIYTNLDVEITLNQNCYLNENVIWLRLEKNRA